MKLHKITRGALVMMVCLTMVTPCLEVRAEDTGSDPDITQTETTTTEPTQTEEPDVTLTETPAPEGSAQITEQIVQDDSNVVGEEPMVFENDPPTEETEDDIQDTEGSTATEEKNAIQKAVDEALKSAQTNSDIKEITIVVEDGTYNGDINISFKDSSSSLTKLYIIARDSFLDPGEGGVIDKATISANGTGGANATGNIYIEGLDVVLAGLYYSLNKKITAKDCEVIIYGTSRDDIIQVELDNASLNVEAGAGVDTIGVTGSGDGTITTDSVILDGGAGSDVYTIDTSLDGTVYVKDTDGGRVHLTGELSNDSGKEPSGTYDVDNKTAYITLINMAAKALHIFTSGIESFTDDLKNKTEIQLKKSDLTEAGEYTEPAPAFANVIYNPEENEEINLIMQGVGLLSKLVIKATNLVINQIKAQGMQVHLTGKNIEVKGVVQAKEIIIEASENDTLLDIGVPDEVNNLIEIDKSLSVSTMDVLTSSQIVIGKDASLQADGNVTLNASGSQKNNIVPSIINVKIGNVKIDILGSITAGGAVTASATSEFDAKADNKHLAEYFVPLAISVVVAESKVNVGEDAVITANGDIKLSSRSDVNLKTISTVGSIPISLALSVIVNDAHVEVLGTLISKSGNVTMEAEGNTTVITKSSKTASQTSENAVNPQDPSSSTPTGIGSIANQFGGFFAVAVVLQDVDAALKGNGRIEAAGDVTVHAKAAETVKTSAVSAGGSTEQNAEGGETVSGVKAKLSSIVTQLKQKLADTKDGFKQGAASKLNTVLGRIDGKSGNTITAQTNEHGAISAPSRAEADDLVTVKVTPNKGYKLVGLTYSYLPAGSASYVTRSIDTSTGTYTFKMPAVAVTIVAAFEKTENNTADEDMGFGDLFDEDEGADMGLGDLFDEGTSGSETEETPTPQNPSYVGNFEIQNFEKKSFDGKTLEGAILSSRSKANAGDTVEITVNPGTGKQLQEGSLKAIYTNSLGKKITYTIPKNTSGKYFLTMPELMAGTVLTFDAVFEDAAPGTASGGTGGSASRSSSQVTGALAVNIVINKNDAYIDTTNEVIAGGTLSLLAEADTYADSNADASNFTQNSATQTTPTNPVTGQPETNTGIITGQQKHGNVIIEATTNGTVTFKSNNQNPQAGDNVAVAVQPIDGYKLTTGSLTYSIKDAAGNVLKDALNNPMTGSLIYDDNTGNYYFTMPSLPEGTQNAYVSITALFEGDVHTVKTTAPTTAEGTLSAAASAQTGDKVNVTVTATSDHKVSKVYYYDTPAAGVTAENNIVEIKMGTDGKWSFIMPSKDITIKAVFILSGYEIIVPGNITADKTRADAGDTVKLTSEIAGQNLTGVKIEYGYRSMFGEEGNTSTTIDYSNIYGEITFNEANGTFVLPAGTVLGDGMIIVVTAGTGTNKKYQVKVEVQKDSTSALDGGIISVPGYVDGGNVLTVRVTPNSGYTLAPNSLKASIEKGTGAAATTELFDITADASGIYKFTVPTTLGDTAVITIIGKFVKGSGSANNPTPLSLGVGVNVSVTNHSNNAYIKNGKITAGGLDIQALSGNADQPITSLARSYAGYSQGAIGVGGAVTVHVVSAKTTAVVLKNAEVTLRDNAAVNLNAFSKERVETVADAGKSERGGIGVGAGIAVAVTGVDVVAGIEEGTKINVNNLSYVTLKAEHSEEERVSAVAGSAGGVSVSPSLAVNISGARTEAYIGAANNDDNNQWQISGDFDLSSASNIYREIAANAEAAGGMVGVGASPVVTVYHDSSRASLNRSIKAQNIKVASESISRLKSTARAGANGAQSGSSSGTSGSSTDSGSDSGEAASSKGESDKQADKSIGGASKLAGTTGNKNIQPGMVSNMTENRQTAQTSEGNMNIAAAFNLNVMKNSSIAEIFGDLSMEAVEDIIVSSVALTEAKIYANASATQSITGIGAAAALNIVSFVNQAYVDQAGLTAGGNIQITALLPEDEKETEADNNASDTEVKTKVKNFVTELVDQAAEKMGLKALFGNENVDKFNNLLSETIANLSEQAIITMLAGTPLEGLQEADLRQAPSKLLLLKEIVGSNIVEQLKTNSQSLLSQLGRVLTTSALDAAFTWLNVDIQKTDRGPAHAFVTEAVAGAGASKVGVAGSIAICVANGSTKAYLGDSAKAVTAGGDLIVRAYSSQSEETTASSAVGKDGKADKNLSAGASGATSGVTPDQAEQKQGNLILSSSVGGKYTATVNGSTVTVTPTALEGYKIGKVTAVNTRTGAAITVTPSGGNYKFTIPTLGEGETITIKVTFEEEPHDILIVPMITTGGELYVTTPVATGEKLHNTSAKMGDKVQVRVVPAAGKQLKAGTLVYVYKDGNGIEQRKQIVTLENPGNHTYAFYMPDFDVRIEAVFEDVSAGTETTQIPVTTFGKSIGVGAAFALDVVNADVEAGIGKNRIVHAENMEVTAESSHYRTTVSVSGTDPISGESMSNVSNSTPVGSGTTTITQSKDYSVDASAAIGLTDLNVKAYVAEGAKIYASGDFKLQAESKGNTLTNASGFSAGGLTAVGAAVAINIADSNVLAAFDGTGEIGGDATVKSYTYNEDDSKALATAIGADIARILGKFQNVTNVTEDNANKVMNGDYENLKPSNNNQNNNTASTVNNRLDANQNSSNQSGQAAQNTDNNLALSTNALRSQGVATESTESGSKAGNAADTANGQVKNNTSGQGGSANVNNTIGRKSIQAAAAVGLNITNHAAQTFINNRLKAKNINLIADNDGNYQTLGSGATMTLGMARFALAMGVAVSVNNNKALVIVGENVPITVEAENDINISADLTQNMDGQYKGYLGAQALAGSVTGSADAAIAGAIAILVSQAETRVTVGEGVQLISARFIDGKLIDGGDIKILAMDKSCLLYTSPSPRD